VSNESNDNVITIKNADEIGIMFEANQIVAGVLALLESEATEGISTLALDFLAEEYCRDHGALPAFKNYKGFPASLCASINEEVVHGIPSSKRILKNGDIVSLDFGTLFKGFYGDSAITVSVGDVKPKTANLVDVTRQSLMKGIEQVQIGNRISDISRAVQTYAESYGFSVVRHFVGHGIGSQLHEPPEVPNYVQRQASPRLVEGMVLAIEPMINLGSSRVNILKDQWTVVTSDRLPSAHFEHSVAVTKSGPFILSERRIFS